MATLRKFKLFYQMCLVISDYLCSEVISNCLCSEVISNYLLKKYYKQLSILGKLLVTLLKEINE